jgi:tetratricopeptide (TPR) repeat protein
MANRTNATRLQRTVQQALKLAVRHHNAGRLDKAAAGYRQVLEADPDNTTALHLMGVTAHQRGDDEKASALIAKAIALDPGYADAHSNLGYVLQALGRTEEALASFYRAVTLIPDFAPAHNNVGNALRSLGRLDEALESYRMAIALSPGFAQAHSNYGGALQELGRLRDAEECFRKAIALQPNYAEAYVSLGAVLRELGQIGEAVASYDQALKLDPEHVTAHANLTGIYITEFDDEARAIDKSVKSLEVLRRSEFGAAASEPALARLTQRGIPLFRLKHDVEQADYLAASAQPVAGIEEFRTVGRDVLKRAEGGPDETVRLSRAEALSALPYLQARHLHQGQEIPNGALNPATDWDAVQERYLASPAEIIHIDDFLSADALASFQRFCLASKVWLKDYPNKYLGAFSDQGFISPLHMQLAHELQQKMPRIFGAHRVGRFWGFKYDATLGKGINVHADFALVNLNFWITPDEHNLDPESGGLIVYDVPSPKDWHFKAYNEDKDGIYRFLEANTANSVNVPYRCNRAVLFNSAYFHETDRIRFRDGYESRRVNVTYLFGRR